MLVRGLVLLTRPASGGYATDILPSLLVLGTGAGLALPGVTTVIMSDASPADAGLASRLANTSQQVGGALGIAVLAGLAAARTETLTAGGSSVVEALTGGYRLAFAASATLVAAASVLTLTIMRPGPANGPARSPRRVEGLTATGGWCAARRDRCRRPASPWAASSGSGR